MTARVTEITNTLFGLNAERLTVTAAHKCAPRGVMILIVGHVVGTAIIKVTQICNVRIALMKRSCK